MRKILIIGGKGYIGSRLRFDLQDYELDSVDLCIYGDYDSLLNQKIDYKTLTKEYLSRYSDIVWLSGCSSVGSCKGNDSLAFSNNVTNLIALFEKLDGQKIIIASSSSVYGGLGISNCNEEINQFNPINTYDLTKHCIDEYLKLSNLHYYSLRFGTLFGPSINQIRGDIMVNKMTIDAKTRGEISAFNLDSKRPLLGINDCCRAIRKIIADGIYEDRGIYNLSSENLNIGTIAKRAAKFLNCELNLGGNTPGVYDFSIDNSKFIDTFNFKFQDYIESGIQQILNEYNSLNITHRNDPLILSE